MGIEEAFSCEGDVFGCYGHRWSAHW